MARPLRVEFPGALYHVMARGNARQSIVADDSDRRRLLATVGEVVEKHNVLCHAYCLMNNHYHLLLETPDGNLSHAMRDIGGRYTQQFNRRHRRVGHLFQGRYKAILVEKESFLLELARYIVLNPVRSGLCRSAGMYPWSSYRATVGRTNVPRWLTIDSVLGRFGEIQHASQRRYAAFVGANRGVDRALQPEQSQVLLGRPEFIERMADHLHRHRRDTDIPRAQRFADRPSLAGLFGDTPLSRSARNARIVQACNRHGYRQREVARFLGLGEATISIVLKKAKTKDLTPAVTPAGR